MEQTPVAAWIEEPWLLLLPWLPCCLGCIKIVSGVALTDTCFLAAFLHVPLLCFAHLVALLSCLQVSALRHVLVKMAAGTSRKRFPNYQQLNMGPTGTSVHGQRLCLNRHCPPVNAGATASVVVTRPGLSPHYIDLRGFQW